MVVRDRLSSESSKGAGTLHVASSDTRAIVGTAAGCNPTLVDIDGLHVARGAGQAASRRVPPALFYIPALHTYNSMAARLGLTRNIPTTRLFNSFSPRLVPRPFALARTASPSLSLAWRSYSSTTPPPAPPAPAPTTLLVPTPPSPAKKSPEEKLGLSARLKALFRKHGWSALTIYLLLSLLDFTLCFLFIYAVGADKVRSAEDWVLDALGWRRRKDGEPGKMKLAVDEWKEQHPRMAKSISHKSAAPAEGASTPAPTPAAGAEPGAVTESNGYSAIATTAVLAYAIHKTLLLPVRVGVTVSSGLTARARSP